MSKELEAILAQARARRTTPEERERQVISFAFGNLRIEHPEVSRATVEEAAAATAGSGQRGVARRRES